MEEELVESVIESIFIILWKGLDVAAADAWIVGAWGVSFLFAIIVIFQQRGQVFASLTKLASNHNLIYSVDKIKTRVLELCVEAALVDVKDANTGTGKLLMLLELD